MKRNNVILAIVLALLGVTLNWAFTQQPEVPQTPAVAAPVELPLNRENLLKLVNEERAKVGVAPLVVDERLNQSAQMKADDMAEYDYYGHTNHDGTQGAALTMKTALGLCKISSENLVGAADSEMAVNSWKGSKPHYEAMVSPDYTLTGFGINGSLVVQHFCQQ